MRVAAISDLHGRLPQIPECNLLIIGGDICPDFLPRAQRMHIGAYAKGETEQAGWLQSEFAAWLDEIPAKNVVGIAGNHDYVFEAIPGIHEHLRWTYLQDAETTVEGLRVYGLPWCPNFPRWAFYGDDRRLQHVYSAVPDGLDILVTHGPPKSYGDKIPAGTKFNPDPYDIHVGAVSATEAITRARPRVTVTGHIHEARGHHVHHNGLPIYNAAHLDADYEPQGGVMWLDEFK